jgi:abortive infection bacteriophage resistance protein
MLNSGGPFFFREPAMKYAKAALTFEQQADKLLGRGLVADRSALINRLKAVNYYRLSGYLYPFRNPDDTFRSGTTLDVVWQRYTFDRQLRLLALDGIERVEVSVRTALVYHHVHTHGPFGYTVPANLPKLPAHRFGRFLTTVDKETQRSHEVFVAHFQKIRRPTRLPPTLDGRRNHALRHYAHPV